MRKTFVAALRLLAQFAREPLSKDLRVASERSYFLREAINTNFEQTRLLADGIPFEFGPSRERDLGWRSRIIQWQLQVRLLFLIRIALWKYRAQLPGFELPIAAHRVLQEFDDVSAKVLDGLANRLEDRDKEQEGDLQGAFARLEQAVRTSLVEEQQKTPEPQLHTLLHLSSKLKGLAISLEEQIALRST